MAKKSSTDDLNIPQSTGAVKFDGAPTTQEQPADASSTGAVEFQAPGTTEVTHYTEDVVVRATVPEPVTLTASWLSEDEEKAVRAAQAKVINAPEQQSVEGTTTAEVK